MSLGRGLQRIKYPLRSIQGIHHGFATSTLSRAPYSVRREALVRLAEQFQLHVWERNIANPHPNTQLREAYTTLLDAVTASPSPRDIKTIRRVLSGNDMVNTLQILAASEAREDHLFLRDILESIHLIMGRPIDSQEIWDVLQGLAETRQTQALWLWLRVLATRPGGISPTTDHMDMLLEHCVQERKWQYMWKAIRLLKFCCQPTNKTFKLLLRGLFQEPVDYPREVHKVIDSIQHFGLPFNPSLLAMIVKGFKDHGMASQAALAADIYRTRIYRPQTVDNRDLELARICILQGHDVAAKVHNSWRIQGFKASQDTLMALLESSWDMDTLTYWESELDLRAESRVWALLIRNALDAGSMEAALVIYRQAKLAGIIPGYHLTYPIVRALCSTSVERSSYDASIDQALEIYKDYLGAVRNHELGQSSNSTILSTRHRLTICNALLCALSLSSNKVKYFPVALDLLTDLRKDKVRLDRVSRTSMLIVLMRTSSSFAEAFQVYELFRDLQPTSLGAQGYSAALNTFASLEFGDMTIPPWKDYFRIITDMQRAGCSYTPHIYTNLLRQISRIALRASTDISTMRQLSQVAVNIHKALSLDPIITPDTACWNQLMDTYQRVQHYEGMHKVWEMLYVSGSVNSASLSIILDACGYSGDLRTARQIYKKFRQRFNQNNWYSWIECLCRLGRFDDAARLVCLEMGKSIPGVQPDEECVRILLKFSKSGRVFGQMSSRIQQYLPELWQMVSAAEDV